MRPARVPSLARTWELQSCTKWTTTPRPYLRSRPYRPNLAQCRARSDACTAAEGLRYRNPLNYVENERARVQHNHRLRKRIVFAATGLGLCLAAQAVIIYLLRSDESVDGKVEKLDAPTDKDAASLDGKEVVKEKPGQPDVLLDQNGYELIETGSSYVPYFPRNIRLSSTTASSSSVPAVTPVQTPDSDEEYWLLGLGVRKVTFLSVKVYVVGLYVRTQDLPKLHAAFVKHINPIGSSLIPGEKDELRRQLLDGEASAEVWDKILREAQVRSVIRIVPTRNTDFGHLRDGFVKGITSRTLDLQRKKPEEGQKYTDKVFEESVGAFKALFSGRGKAPYGSELLLTRDQQGALTVLFGEREGRRNEGELVGKETLGKVEDERVSRLIWLGYVGGNKVSSELARKSIVDGVMELVERPVGTTGIQTV